MTQPARSSPRVVERTENHALGVYGDIVIMYTFPGCVDDPRHVFASVETVIAESRRGRRPVRSLIVFPDEPRPPSAALREAWQKAIPSTTGHVASVAMVVRSTGFGGAIQRAVVSSLMMLLRGRVVGSVQPDLRAALRYLGVAGAEIEAVARFCEGELRG
jgi:hypothetical protein